jgi:hypothetical protein
MENDAEAAGRRRRTGEAVSRLVSEFEGSTLGAGAFCRRYGLAPSTLRRRLKKRRGRADGRLVAVRVNGSLPSEERTPGAALEVRLTAGRRIGVAPGFDAATLSRLVRTLEGL